MASRDERSDVGEGQWDDLVGHLTRTTPLTAVAARRIVQEVVAHLDETAEAFIRRRHRELQAAGRANLEIFGQIIAELATRPVAAPTYTERQIRRVIYG